MRIGFLGSTCDPPHRMHVTLGKAAQHQLKLDRVFLMPIGRPPHKEKLFAARRERLAMARSIARKNHWGIWDRELRRPGISSTRDAIRTIQKKYPRDELFWIIGSDTLASLPTWQWKGGADILDLCTFVVAPRIGFPIHSILKKLLKKVILLRGIRPTSISSNRVRTALRDGKNLKGLLDLGVLRYIRRHHLYTSR